MILRLVSASWGCLESTDTGFGGVWLDEMQNKAETQPPGGEDGSWSLAELGNDLNSKNFEGCFISFQTYFCVKFHLF